MQAPAQAPEHMLPQAVPVPGGPRYVVSWSIALDAQQVAARSLGVDHRKVDEAPGRTDPVVRLVSEPGQGQSHGLLERRISRVVRLLGRGFCSGRGVGQERLQRPYPLGVGAAQVDVLRRQVGEHFAALFGPGDQHVQPALPAVPVQRPKVHVGGPVSGAPVPDADENDVSLVALHRLQVLDEERLVGMGREEPLAGGVLPPEQLQLVLDCPHLGRAEGGHAEGQARAGPGVVHHGPRHLFRLQLVCPAVPPVVHRIGKMAVLQPQILAGRVGAREDHQAAVVELPVRNGDQRLVAAAIVPSQHPVGRALGCEQAQYALDVGGRVLLVVVVPVLGHGVEEIGRRKLLAVPHDDSLIGAENGAEGVDRFHLAGLIEDNHVEFQTARRDVGGNGEGAHHEYGLDRLDRVAGPLH